MNSLELVDQCRSGDARAIETIVFLYQEDIYRLALSILSNPQEAEEATQDTFIAALNALDSYRVDAAMRTWLYAIAVNVCRGRLRKRRTRLRLMSILRYVVPNQSRGTCTDPEEKLIANERNAAILRAVHSLDMKLRLPIMLRYAQELRIADIAAILGISERSVHVRLKKAHLALRIAVSEEGNTE